MTNNNSNTTLSLTHAASAKMPEICISYSRELEFSQPPKICCSQDAFETLSLHWSKSIGIQEEFNMLLLNRSNHVLSFCNVSKGGISATIVDLKLVFGIALKAGASSLIFAHNHPSRELNPSKYDIELTKRCKQAGKILDIKILDHLILSDENKYFSFADANLL